MGRPRKDTEEDTPPKPKKIFIITHEIWDDGEVTTDLVEKVQGDRGAPKSWRLDAPEFITSVKARIAENKIKLLEDLCKGLSITPEDIKNYYAPSVRALEKEEESDKDDDGTDNISFEEK